MVDASRAIGLSTADAPLLEVAVLLALSTCLGACCVCAAVRAARRLRAARRGVRLVDEHVDELPSTDGGKWADGGERPCGGGGDDDTKTTTRRGRRSMCKEARGAPGGRHAVAQAPRATVESEPSVATASLEVELSGVYGGALD